MHENLMFKVEPVGRDNLAQFIRYAAAHGSEHDESYLPDKGFAPSQEHPAYMLMKSGEVVGGVSLMRTPRYLEARRGRFSFFHCVEASYQTYSLLFVAIQRHFDGLDSVYLFLPEDRRASAKALAQLGFAIERYSYIMKTDNVTPAGLVVPEGLTLLPIQPSDEHFARLFADTINANFSELAGHVPTHADLVREWIEEDTYLEDGIALLLEGRRAVGTVGVMCDSEDHNAGEIMALSVEKEYRGRGLGQLLLRHAVCFATWRGLRPVFLSVNAENRAALRLYQSEGFSVTDMMVCYSRDGGAAKLPSGSPARQD
jgi:ribosomal protein S18 acetylase RimI-like enzyme